MDLLERYGRKLLSDSLNAIHKAGADLKNAGKFENKINNLKTLFAKNAFKNIY